MRGYIVASITLVLMLSWWCDQAPGQQRPTIGYAYPAGVQRGKSTEIQLGGYDLTPDTEFLVREAGVTLELLSEPGPMIYPGAPYWFGPRALNSYKPFAIPREVMVRITVPENYPDAVVHWQVANANGASEPAEIVIADTMMTECLEEDCEKIDHAKRLPSLPVVINARLERKEEVDRYAFTADRDGLVTCEIPTGRFGFPVHAAIQISDSAGNQIVDEVDTVHDGIATTFAVQKNHGYTLRIHDLDFRGNRSMVYRMCLRYGPRVVAMLPTNVPPGRETKVTFIGYGIATGKPQRESIQRKVTSADQSFAYQLVTDFGSAGTIFVPVSSTDELVVTPSPNAPTTLSLPACVSSTLDERMDFHTYEFLARKGETWSVDLRSFSDGGADMAVTVVDPGGRTVATIDDAGNSSDARGLIKTTLDGTYRLVVTDQNALPDRAVVYRLWVRQPDPCFRLMVPARVETIIGAAPITPPKRRRPNQQTIGVIGVDIERLDGFDGAIHLSIDSIPNGLHVPDEIIIGSKDVGIDIPIHCDQHVTPGASEMTITAYGKGADGGTACVQTGRTLLTPIMSPRAIVQPKYPDAARTVHRGTTYPAPVVIERLNDYQGPVELQMAGVPDRVRQGILGHPCTMMQGQTEGLFPLIIPEWVQTDRTSRIILNSIVRVPDANGREWYLVNRMARRITMNVEGALLKVATAEDYFHLGADPLSVPVELFRSGELSGPVVLQLRQVGADATSDIVSAKSVWVAADDRTATLIVQADRNRVRQGEFACVIRAEANRHGYPVVSETEIVIAIGQGPPPLPSIGR